MDFDFKHVAVPFRMQPGLRRLAGDEKHLTPLDPAGTLAAEKRQVLDAAQCLHAVPGFDAAPVLEAIRKRARDEGHTAQAAALRGVNDLPLAFEEDFAVLDGQSGDGQLAWLCICTPSHWAPEDKLGLGLASIHAPVADNAMLQSASSHLVQLATGGERWERFVWTVSPSPRYDQHPRRQPRTAWPEASTETFAASCFLRSERQTFFPVGQGTRQAVFTIRVMLQPLNEAVRTREQAQRLHDSLASMTDAVLDYKNLANARPALLSWLNRIDR